MKCILVICTSLLILFTSIASAQSPITPGMTAARSAMPTVCVNPSTFLLESCGGGGGGGDGAILDGVTASIRATVRDLTNSNPVSVILTDTNGDVGNATIFSGDNIGAQSLLGIHALGYMWDGAAWDRVLGNSSTGLLTNIGFLNGTAPVTGGVAGSLAIGGTAGNNAAITQNPVLAGCEAITYGTQPTAATSGNQRRVLCTTEGAITVTPGHNRFSCFLQAVTVTTTCQAAPAAGLRNYVLSVAFSNQAATAQSPDIVYGTGAACATGTTAISHKFTMGTNATTTTSHYISQSFNSPLVPAAATAICVRPSAATAFGATITGYIAP